MRLFKCFGFTLIAISMAAWAEPSLLAPHKTVAQQFESANSPSQEVAQVVSKPLPKQDQLVATPRIDKEMQASLKQQAQNISTLQDKVIAISQASLDYQQKNAEQLLTITQTQNELQTKVSNLVAIMKALNTEVAHIQHQNDSAGWSTKIGVWLDTLGPNVIMGLMILLLVVIAILMILILRQGKAFAKQNQGDIMSATTAAPIANLNTDNALVNNEVAGVDEADYDFLGSEEGVDALLDLARAHIAMQDYHQARNVLNQVLERGDEQQRQTAQDLLGNFPYIS